ncbi:MAG TPA: methyltransferase domain-containing protein [Rudaea sp.]|nr:methyltransferase domain-containing protein [Rudaea sp.]
MQLSDFETLFVPHGGTDLAYLRQHFDRYVRTRQRFLAHGDPRGQGRMLDVGAHWLHQALLYSLDGFEVTALDLPSTLDLPEVRSLAQAHGIRILPNADLEHPSALAAVADDTFDAVLFTEVIEHLAFNPVGMWREIYRVMRPGARIVVTTPNYYALRSSVRRWLRVPVLLGGGIAVDSILRLKSLALHWKEYSRRELVRYFRLLSPDFVVRNLAHVEEYHPAYLGRPSGKVLPLLERAIPPLRPDLYAEVELTRKDKGIIVEPHW